MGKFRWEILDREGNLIGEGQGVVSGAIQHKAERAAKGSAVIKLNRSESVGFDIGRDGCFVIRGNETEGD